MEKIKFYTVAQGDNCVDLMETVNKLIKVNGFAPLGGVSVVPKMMKPGENISHIYSQAMIQIEQG